MVPAEPGFSAEHLADLADEQWDIDFLSEHGLHISFDRRDFPAQIDVMFDAHDDNEWQVSLYVYNEQRGMMDLLSADYANRFDPADEDGVRECIVSFMRDVDSGELDEYRTDLKLEN